MRVPNKTVSIVWARALRGDVKIKQVTCKNICTLCMRSTFHLITVAARHTARQRAAYSVRLECVNDLVACLSAAPKSGPHSPNRQPAMIPSMPLLLPQLAHLLLGISFFRHFLRRQFLHILALWYLLATASSHNNHDSHHCWQTYLLPLLLPLLRLNGVAVAIIVAVAAAACCTTKSKAQCDACCDAGKTRKWFFIKMT